TSESVRKCWRFWLTRANRFDAALQPTRSRTIDHGQITPALDGEFLSSQAIRHRHESPTMMMTGSRARTPPRAPPLTSLSLVELRICLNLANRPFNLSFTLPGRTTRATGGTMREFIPGAVR